MNGMGTGFERQFNNDGYISCVYAVVKLLFYNQYKVKNRLYLAALAYSFRSFSFIKTGAIIMLSNYYTSYHGKST